MKKESVNKFDLEAAFKALEEIEIPVVRGIKPNRENLKEKFTKKTTTEVLVEDYFDLNDQNDLEAAQEDREAEIAKAKLARIEKIVDLEAESEEDLLPSYVGKVIIQCPQCMTLFYKNQEDIEKSDENPDVVNINETCQHCGNNSGYTLIGKVDTVGEDEAENYDVEDFEEDELNLDFPEGTEEPSTEEAAEEEEIELEPIEMDETEEEPAEEETSEEEEEEVKESLREAVDDDETEEIEDEEVVEDDAEEEILLNVEGVKDIAAEAGEAVAEVVKENPEVETEEIREITDEVVDTAISEVETEEEVIEDEVSEEEKVEESLNLDPAIASRFISKNSFNKLTPEEIAILKNPRDREAINKIIAKYNKKEESLKEALNETINSDYANMHSEAVGEIITVNRQDLALAHDLDKKACEIFDAEFYKDNFDELEDDLCAQYGISSFSGVELFEALAEEAGLEWTIAEISDISDLKVESLKEDVEKDFVVIQHYYPTLCRRSQVKEVTAALNKAVDLFNNGTLGGIDEIEKEAKYISGIKEFSMLFMANYEALNIPYGQPMTAEQYAKCVLESDLSRTLYVVGVNIYGKPFRDELKKAGYNSSKALRLKEAVDKELDAKLKAHNEYIEYLKEEIEKAEKALEDAKNDFVKKSIQSKLDALKTDLEEALPEALKAEVTASDELPTPEESGLEDAAENKEETKESLAEALQKNPNISEKEINKILDDKSLSQEEKVEKIYEDVKIIGDLSDYSPWSGAVDTWNKIKDAGLVDDLDMYLEDCYPEGLTMTELNDILWFEGEEILNYLGIGEEEVDESLTEDAEVEVETKKPAKRVRHQSQGELVSRELAKHPLFAGISTRIIERCLIPLYTEDTNGPLTAEDIIDYYSLGGFGELIFRYYEDLSYEQIKTFAKKDPLFMTAMENFLKRYNIYPDASFEVINFSEIFEVCFEMRDNNSQAAKEHRADTMKRIEKEYRKVEKNKTEALLDLNIDARGQSVGIAGGQGGDMGGVTNEEVEKLDEFVGPAITTIAGASVANNLINKAFEDVERPLTEEGDLNTLLDSEEFKKPISDAEVSKIIAKYESLEEDVEPGIESEIAIQDIVDTWESVEEIDEESLNKLTESYLTDVYSNVKSFKTTDCSLDNNKLVVEGTITFNSGKSKSTQFIYEATKNENNKVVLEGLNADFATEKAFILNCNLDTANCLVVESLNYKYTINNTLVEGLAK